MTDNVSVAIVDDERDLVRTYELLFKRRGIPMAFVAYDGHSALDKFKNAGEKPGVVIIDYRLPDMDGLDVMKEVMAIQPGTKIVFISGDDSVRQEAIDAGAKVFLKKPTDIKMITETITALINNA
jgi:two-component system, chemotaxis family, chemotaxis protein CheY